ncbi:DMT family transporter [Aquitalea denitrificans]|uniref:DMT family transporter n=1 Tax=Aquitalea denitrificans TaxID=519081 RepID=UPI0013585A37|nr:DMT family transporter [Aquitalea denitrificans]
MKRGVSYAGLAGAVWGMVLMVPQVMPAFSPWLLSAVRFTLYGVISLLLALPLAGRIRAKLQSRDLLMLTVLSLVGNLLYFILLAAAIQLVGIAPASLIVGVLPVTITLLGLKDEGALSLRQLAWPLAMVLAGIVCINIDTFALSRPSDASLLDRVLGVLAALGALASWSWFAASNARYLRQRPCFDSHEWSCLLGMVTGIMGGVLWLVGKGLGLPMVSHAVSNGQWQLFWLAAAACALGGSWLANALWYAAARRLPPTLSGQLIVFETLFALLYGFAWLQRWPRPLELASMLLLLGGVAWAVRRHAAPDEPATEVVLQGG